MNEYIGVVYMWVFLGSMAEQCSGATWRVFCYGVITATISLTLIAVIAIITWRPACGGTCFPRKAQVENHLPTSGLFRL